LGADDRFPSPQHVADWKRLETAGKTYEFHSYEGAGHAFFSADRPSYRPEAAKDGWQRIWGVLRPIPASATSDRAGHVHLPDEKLQVSGSAKGPEGWFSLSSVTVYFDHPAHHPAEHSLNIDFLNLDDGAPSRVAVELDPAFGA